jgi:hypothetical protein
MKFLLSEVRNNPQYPLTRCPRRILNHLSEAANSESIGVNYSKLNIRKSTTDYRIGTDFKVELRFQPIGKSGPIREIRVIRG